MLLLPKALLFAAVGVVLVSGGTEEVSLKIVKTKPTPKPVYAATVAAPIASREPRAFSGPEAFRPLLGQCWTTSSGGYEYKLCPFQNVTQKAVGRTHNLFHGILGSVDTWTLPFLPSHAPSRSQDMGFLEGSGHEIRFASVYGRHGVSEHEEAQDSS